MDAARLGGEDVRDSYRAAILTKANNYFALLKLFDFSEAKVAAAWIAVESQCDVKRPLIQGNGPAVLARLGIEPRRFQNVYRSVVRHGAALDRDDLVVELGDSGYPPRLAQTEDAPRFLFLRGRTDLLDGSRPAIAVVGTRDPSDEGRLRARKVGYLLARNGIVVVSGLARGIDEAAHRGALEVGGDTVAVLGTPLTRAYPQEHAPLQALIGGVGCLVSQFHPAAGVRRHFFPLRNATMSGLCLGTVVVEASETSGALIQARKCLQQRRKLFIPQSAVDDTRLTWPRRFLERGAHVFRTIDDLLQVLESEGLFQKSQDERISAEARPEIVTLVVRFRKRRPVRRYPPAVRIGTRRAVVAPAYGRGDMRLSRGSEREDRVGPFGARAIRPRPGVGPRLRVSGEG
jgi:DNA processing protein